jgi:hypothetical protein
LDDLGAFGRRHVNDVEPAAGRLGPGDGPLNCFGLDEVRPRQDVQICPVPFHLACVVMSGDQFVQNAAALSVNEQHAAELPHLLQRPEDRGVVGLPPLRGVDHELLERRDALADHRRQLAPVPRPVREADVKGVIDAGDAVGLGHPRVDGLLSESSP